MKMTYKGIVGAPAAKEPKQANALFWTKDGHQVSMPVDKDLEKCCSGLEPEQEVDLVVAISGVPKAAEPKFALPKLSEKRIADLKDASIAAMGCGVALAAWKIVSLAMAH